MSRLEKSSEEYRKNLLVKNEYKTGDEYISGHKNATADGDEKGKGESDSGAIGGLTDIKTREKSLLRNKYSNKKPYDSSNA